MFCVCVTVEHERHGGRDADEHQTSSHGQERHARLPADQRRRQLPTTCAVQSAALRTRHT